MKCLERKILLIFFLALVFILVVLKVSRVWAETTDYLSAFVKISICGNEIVEGGEDCEGDNLNGQTCESLGFGSGTLSCDIACSFDAFNCSPAPTNTPTPTASSATTSETMETPATVPTTSFPEPAASLLEAPLSLPVILFDPDGDGKIALKEIFIVVKNWVEEWRQTILEEAAMAEKGMSDKKNRKCDLNKDYKCNLKDLSILLFYVER